MKRTVPGRSRTPSPRSLRATDGFKAFVLDQLEELGDVTARSMFGGSGLYCRGVFFGIIARDVLYLKTDDRNRPDFERAGMRPFKPYPNRIGTLRYYAVPVAVLESGIELAAWARKAVAAAEHDLTVARKTAKSVKDAKGREDRRRTITG